MSYDFTLIYDSNCQLCTRFKKALELVDIKNTIRFVSVHDQSIYVEFPELDQAECESEVHLLDKDKKVYVGGEVIEQLLKSLPQVKKFSWLIDSDSSKKAIGSFYKRLNKMRQMKKANCYTCGSKRR